MSTMMSTVLAKQANLQQLLQQTNQENQTPCHSFTKVNEIDGVHIFYTCPARAKEYDDKRSILDNYANGLSKINGAKWVWIFDSNGFSVKHAGEVGLAKDLTKIINGTHGETLQEIRIVNPTWHIKSTLKLLTPFLNSKTREKIRVLDDRYYSLIEFVSSKYYQQ